MARVTLTAQDIVIAGLNPTFVAAEVDGNAVANTPVGNVFFAVKNGGGSAITCTLPTPAKVSGIDIEDPTVSVPAAGERWILIPSGIFTQSDGTAYINYTGVTSVTVAAVRIP